MKLFPFMFIKIIAILIIFSCDRDKNPVLPFTSTFVYPLEVGNQWEYSRTFSLCNFKPQNGQNAQSPDTIISDIVIMKITNIKVIDDSISTYEFQETIIEDIGTFSSNSYYSNLDDGLYFYGYDGAGTVIPKITSTHKILFNDRYFNTVQELSFTITKMIPKNYTQADSLIIENPPLLSLKYPLKIGSEWTYRSAHQPWLIQKKIVASEKVSVAAGNFHCYKIQWLYDMDDNQSWDNNIIFYDYVCDQGLIKRSILFKDLILMGVDGEILGLFDNKDETVLTKFSLK